VLVKPLPGGMTSPSLAESWQEGFAYSAPFEDLKLKP
jgi:hypothetical protein